jgi:hypothetical protein
LELRICWLGLLCEKVGGSGRKGKGKVGEPFLPHTIDDERTCKWCYVLNTCMLFCKVSFPFSLSSLKLTPLSILDIC